MQRRGCESIQQLIDLYFRLPKMAVKTMVSQVENDNQGVLFSDKADRQLERPRAQPKVTRKRTYKQGANREQEQLLPLSLEDYVSQTNPVRAIEAYVNVLDMAALGYENTQGNAHASGHPAYDPAMLLKLYLYGYLNRSRSSRVLERECQRNIEVLWLLQGLKPSYKTIADFRKNNPKALRATHREFIALCQKLDLLGGQCVAIDGSFFKGNVSAKSFITKRGLKRSIDKRESEIDQWLKELDQNDQKEPLATLAEQDPELKEKLLALEKAKGQLNALEEAGKTQHSHVDPDARLLSKSGKKCQGYNVQTAIDDKHHLIVGDEVTSAPNDLNQLYPLAKQVKQALGLEHLNVLADAGYYNSEHLRDCMNNAITPFVAEPRHRSGNRGRYSPNDFKYDAQNNQYQCPAGEALTPSGTARAVNNHHEQRYTSKEKTCRDCALRDLCITQKAKVREIWRSDLTDVMEAHHQRMKENPTSMADRACLAEHPFGTLKARAGWSHFLVRGRERVSGEWSLMALLYNFTRVLNLIGLDAFIEYCLKRHMYVLKRLLRGLLSACVRIFWVKQAERYPFY